MVLFMNPHLAYEKNIIPALRFQYCPMCKSPLTREIIFDDHIPRVRCSHCGWIQLTSNAIGITVVVRSEKGIVAIFPPNEEGVGLPAGLVEYGEAPEAAALREVFEETGLQVKIVDCLGWYYSDRQTWPGPTVQFMYETEIIGGEIRGSDEGRAEIFPPGKFPPISSKRIGSQRAMQAYISKANSA